MADFETFIQKSTIKSCCKFWYGDEKHRFLAFFGLSTKKQFCRRQTEDLTSCIGKFGQQLQEYFNNLQSSTNAEPPDVMPTVRKGRKPIPQPRTSILKDTDEPEPSTSVDPTIHGPDEEARLSEGGGKAEIK
ncbi:hypothetical protein RF11_01491 [Thelohanellus kitauei]|uniref:Uncharacterized protein n=1 Tax=Thelohanellus kitauei TaxID=669202 RepID=A0A0C2IA50_THEKT|nr:hypothetical protein RF11_01491 [Thelohanellus kitauei]